MKVIALVGPSGTGKSYRAIGLAGEIEADCIIDDGLLIKDNQMVAGKSAKREGTRFAAVRRAVFSDEDHKRDIIEAIKEIKPNGILVLGTSKKMVDQITDRLGIGKIDEYIYIEEITTKEEREIARKERNELGKHVIPVPTFEIKKDFSGYFLDPLRILKKRKDDTIIVSEKSIVRPTFSYLGKYKISNKVIKDLVVFGAGKVSGVHKITKINVTNYIHGIVIDIELVGIYGNPIIPLMMDIQKNVKKEVEGMTAIHIIQINVVVKSLIVL